MPAIEPGIAPPHLARMRTVTDLATLSDKDRGCVVALGNFDGVHKGHAGLLAEARDLAASRNARLAVLTFEPHPRQLFRPEDPPFRLASAERRAALLADQGVEILYQMPFTPAFAALEAQAFEQTILHDRLAAVGVVTGGNFRYGAGRGGNIERLAAFGAANAMPVVKAHTIRDGRGEPYSSSRVRQALLDARPDHAADVLGRYWDIAFTVEHGDKRGRQIGFPTANGRFGPVLTPAYGIYAIRAWLADEPQPIDGVASIGIRPMWQTTLPTIEAHLFDFDREIYGETLRVEMVSYLRPEARFEGVEALIQQIGLDCGEARLALAAATDAAMVMETPPDRG